MKNFKITCNKCFSHNCIFVPRYEEVTEYQDWDDDGYTETDIIVDDKLVGYEIQCEDCGNVENVN